MIVNDNNVKIWASLIAPNPDDVSYWVDLTADPHGNIIKFYDEGEEKWLNLTSPTSDYAIYPYIGPNGNWFIENKDSGVSATGEMPNTTINGYLIASNPVLTKYDIGLGNVANLAPEEYPIPDGVYGLIANKVDVTRTINGHELTGDIALNKNDIGLSSVENIAPANMPISTAVATALAGKLDAARNIIAGTGLSGGGILTGDVTLNMNSANDGITINADNIQLNVIDSLDNISATKPLSANQGKVLNESKVSTTRTINTYPLSSNIVLNKTDIGLGNVSNLAPVDLPISTATQSALDGKVNTNRQVIAGNGLTGGGALTSDVTLNVSSGNDGITASADAVTLNTVNNLISTSVTQPLSAAQGKALQDGKINNNGTNSNIDVLHFNPTTLTALTAIGDVRFSPESSTLEVKVSDTVSIQLGQEMQTRVKNNAGVQINNGQVVYIDSASGANPLAKLATTADPDIAQRTFGMATEGIAINGFGAITTEGLVRDINTSAFAEGAMLWLSTNGSITTTEPVAPTPKISVGMVLRSNTNNGVIYVKIRAVARNSKLSDVYAPTLANGNILRWNSTTSRFEVWDSITSLANKVDVVAGKGLSSNDYTTAEKNKLAGIAAGAEVNVNADWNAVSGDAQILNKPTTLAGYGITNAYTKAETDIMMTAVYKYKGVVATSANLPSTGMVVGDVWNVTDTNINYAWDGSVWDPLGGVVGADVSLATSTTDGLLSASDFVKLSGIAAGAEVNVNPDWNAVSGDAQILNKPTTISGYGITDAYTKTQVDTSLSGKEPTITAGTTSKYWRGDKSWQTLDKSTVGLGNVENTALSTWAGSTNLATLGTITNGTWSASTIAYTKGGTGLTALGTANQLLRVNSGASALEYFTPTWTNNTGTVTSISMSVPTGLTVVGSPITTAGTFELSFTSGYSIPTTTKQGQWDTAYGWGNHSGLYQLLDADLTSIAGLAGTTGLLRKTAANTWSLDTATYLTGITKAQVEAVLTGTITSHNHTGVYEPLITKTTGYAKYNGSAWSFVNETYSLSSHTHSYQPIDADLTAIAGLAGTSGFLKKTAADTWALDTSTYLTGNQTITLSGAVSGSGTTAITTAYAGTVPTTKGGTGLTTIGTAGQVLAVNAGATALEYKSTSTWDTAATNISNVLPIINRENTAYGPVVTSTISGMTNVARVLYIELSASSTLSFAEHPTLGKDLHLVVKNTNASAITITIPNTGDYISTTGTSLTIAAGGFGEINILCYTSSKYLIRAI